MKRTQEKFMYLYSKSKPQLYPLIPHLGTHEHLMESNSHPLDLESRSTLLLATFSFVPAAPVTSTSTFSTKSSRVSMFPSPFPFSCFGAALFFI